MSLLAVGLSLTDVVRSPSYYGGAFYKETLPPPPTYSIAGPQ